MSVSERMAVALLLAAAPASGEVVDVSLTTRVAGRQIPRDGKLDTFVPVWEHLSLRASNLENRWAKDLRVVVEGFGSMDLAGIRKGSRIFGDLDLGYVEGVVGERALLRLGRQVLYGGVARGAQVDGLWTRLGLWGGLALEAYGGATVHSRFGWTRGDALAGTRLAYRRSWESEAGLSFIHVQEGGRSYRQELGLDARWTPWTELALVGAAQWSTAEGRLSQASADVTWQPAQAWEGSLSWKRTAPDLFVSRGSIFSVFSVEERDEVGGAIAWRPWRGVSVEADHRRVFSDSGDGQRTALRGRWRLTPPSAVGCELERLIHGEGGYWQARAFGFFRPRPDLSIGLDLAGYIFDEPVNGELRSVTASLSAGYTLTPQWSLWATAVGGATPFLERRLEGMARLVYLASFNTEEGE